MKNLRYSLSEQGSLQHELTEELEEMKWKL